MTNKVFVVTGLDLGWDRVVGVFDFEEVELWDLQKRFPEDRYVISQVSIEKNLEYWE